MLARIIQPLIGQSVILVKESSVLSIITVGELTNTAMTIANQTYAMVEIYVLMAIVYWGMAMDWWEILGLAIAMLLVVDPIFWFAMRLVAGIQTIA